MTLTLPILIIRTTSLAGEFIICLRVISNVLLDTLDNYATN